VERWKLKHSDRVVYKPIYEGPLFHMGIFAIPRGGSIPLHDHPEMTVISKLLFGKVRLQSYDWVTKSSSGGTAKKVLDEILLPPVKPHILYPSQSNLHCFTAVDPCAFFDILMPPYNETRKCSYYKIEKEENDLVEISEIDVPDF